MARKDYIVGSVNVFEDLGHSQPAQALAKTGLARKIAELFAKRRLTQAAGSGAAERRSTEGGGVGSRPAHRFLARPARLISATTRQRTPQQMPIPELELARVKRALDKFCDRIPMQVRADLTNHYRFKGNSVILIERRPSFRGTARHTEHEFAKFVYNQRLGAWSLRWRDRNGGWHAYDGFQDMPHFRDVLAEVASDPTCIFLG